MSENDDVVFSYSRAQAIADGVLHDASALAEEAGFRYPVALTAAAWADCVAWPAGRCGVGQSEKGRLWDVLYMARLAIKRATGPMVQFTVLVAHAGGCRPQPIRLKMMVGPGDELEPVITIMLPSED